MKQATGSVYLSDLSPKDKNWDDHRSEVDAFKSLYSGTQYDHYVARLDNCSRYLVFAFAIDDNGICELKLQAAKFCRVPMCPVCQWRRALKWTSKTFSISPRLREQYPKSRYILLTLTVRSCKLHKLRETISHMNKSWTRLTHLKSWPAQGWIRSTEVTRGQDDTAHPHFHCLLMVTPGYFSTGYISQDRWRELWRDCLRVSYDPILDVRAIKPSKDLPKDIKDDPLAAALVETVKYTFKASDVLRGENCQIPGERVRMTDQEWLVELTTQLYKTRRVATGGILKQYLKILEDERTEEKEDLVHINEGSESESEAGGPTVGTEWNGKVRRYRVPPTPDIESADIQPEHVIAFVN